MGSSQEVLSRGETFALGYTYTGQHRVGRGAGSILRDFVTAVVGVAGCSLDGVASRCFTTGMKVTTRLSNRRLGPTATGNWGRIWRRATRKLGALTLD
jgi:hypothetical protein